MRISFVHRRFDELSLQDLHDLLRLREEVFVVGQGITAEAEIDGRDPECLHVLGRDNDDRVVATARLFCARDPVKVGRIAVHPDLQRRGIGTALMNYVHHLLGVRAAEMSAQAHLRPWYGRLGWEAEGAVYHEAGIPHVRMTRAGTGIHADPGQGPPHRSPTPHDSRATEGCSVAPPGRRHHDSARHHPA